MAKNKFTNEYMLWLDLKNLMVSLVNGDEIHQIDLISKSLFIKNILTQKNC
jgi:hypothetical protein